MAVVISETRLTFGEGGLVPCDAQAPARTVTLRNDSRQALTLTSASSRSPSAYEVNLPELVAAGATVLLEVTPHRVPKTADTSPDFFAETLTVRATGEAIDETHAIALHLTAEGARLTFAPRSLTFSAASPDLDTREFIIENAGSAAATIELSTEGRFTLLSSRQTIGAGQKLSVPVTFTPNHSPGQSSGAIELSTSSTICAPLPRELELVGNSL